MEETFDIVESPDNLDDSHSSLVIQGITDAMENVSGQESYATRYLMGSMAGAGMLDFNFDGSESVWSSVKEGFSKSVTYVKNFFMGIWNFFFGKESEEKDKALEEEVKDDAKELESLGEAAEAPEAGPIRTAINAATKRLSDAATASKKKIESGVDKAKAFMADSQIQKTLTEVVNQLQSDILKYSVQIDNAIHEGTLKAAKAGRALALAATLWASSTLYLTRNRVSAMAKQTKAKIEELEAMVRKGVEEKKEEITKRLASLRETMKIYTEIQNMKTNVRSFLTALKGKLKVGIFKKNKPATA